MSPSIKRAISFLKWQLVPVRYLGRLRYLRPKYLFAVSRPKRHPALDVEKIGYAVGPNMSSDLLTAFQQVFLSRAPLSAPENMKAPFINLSRSEDFVSESPLLQFAFSKEVLDVAIDYFGGNLTLDSLQVLHSFPVHGALKESQKWHLDYGDSRSLHCVAYLNDVVTDNGGPFAFVDKNVSMKVGRGMIVRRIEDDRFLVESGGAKPHIVYGRAGSSIWVDPAACYHYGSRCKEPRTAVFVTFNSAMPFMAPVPLIQRNRERIAGAGKLLRPDLDPTLFDRMLRI